MGEEQPAQRRERAGRGRAKGGPVREAAGTGAGRLRIARGSACAAEGRRGLPDVADR